MSVYDEEIAPQLALLAQKCVDNGMSFVSAVEKDGLIAETSMFAPGFPFSIQMVAYAVRAVGNIDKFAISCYKWAKKNGGIYSSMVLCRIPKGRKLITEEMIEHLYERGIDVDGESGKYDLHHAILSKNDVVGLPKKEREKIDDVRNILVVDHWKHIAGEVPSRKEAVEILEGHYGESVREWWDSIKWKVPRYYGD